MNGEKHIITIAALGPDSGEMLTLGVYDALKSADRLLLRTGRHGVAERLTREGVAFETLDALYERTEDFDEPCELAARAIIDRARQAEALVYAVSEPQSDATVRALAGALPEGFALRALGMVFRVFVAARLGPEGMGLYQLILSVYMVFVSLASAGIVTVPGMMAGQIIAGGTDVLVQMREGKRAGKALISIQKCDEMRGVSIDAEENIRIGSLTSFTHITNDPIIQQYINVLGEAVDMVGGPQIRNAGTIGGNTCNGVTSADSASTLHAWEAIVEITGKNGVRRVPIKDFYIKAGTVDLRVEDGEIQTAILIPKTSYDRTWGHYIKYAMRNAMDIATLGTSVNARLSADGKTFERVRIAFGVAGPVPMRAESAEAFINGKAVTLENIEEFGRRVLEDIHPRDSWRASKAFRSHIAVESAKRCLIESVKLAGGVL